MDPENDREVRLCCAFGRVDVKNMPLVAVLDVGDIFRGILSTSDIAYYKKRKRYQDEELDIHVQSLLDNSGRRL